MARPPSDPPPDPGSDPRTVRPPERSPDPTSKRTNERTPAGRAPAADPPAGPGAATGDAAGGDADLAFGSRGDSRSGSAPAPGGSPAPSGLADASALAELLAGRRVLLLSGAGISTESGIPDYRGPGRGERVRKPMLYQQFVRSAAARQRYWARSLRGWPTVAAARPNRGHRAVARLQAAGALTAVLTQNVDGLHQAAGSREVVELHGSLARVRCLQCGAPEARARLQARMLAANPGFLAQARAARAARIAPDGDADLPPELEARFRVPECESCGGVLKPDVVFFGENVPAPRVERAWQLFEAAEVLLVVGSSLTVRSGYRFVARAASENRPVAIVNDGPTRGDADATVRLSGRLGRLLPEVAALLTGTDPDPDPEPSAAPDARSDA